jgi:hypothetical protein
MFFRYQRVHWIYAIALVLVLCANWFGSPPEQPTAEKVAGLFGATIVFTSLVLVLLLARRVFGSRSGGTVAEHAFDISADSITETNPHGRVETRAEGIRSVDETPGYFFVIAKTGYGHIIPKAALGATGEIRELQATVRARKA